MKLIFVILLSVLVAPLFAQTIPLSLKASLEKVTIFGEGLISTVINERDFALSPAGK